MELGSHIAIQREVKVRIVDEMTLSKISPTTVVLGLMALLCSPVLSMNTGYDYGPEGCPKPANQYGHLKCAYLFAANTNLRLVRLLLAERSIPTKYSVYMLSLYDIQAVICTLYGVAEVEIGTLWVLLLYTNIVQNYYEHYIYPANEINLNVILDRLVVIHDYVAKKIQRELSEAGCPPGNQFDSYAERYKRLEADILKGQISMYNIRKETVDLCNELDNLLKKNRAYRTYGRRYDGLKPRQMFLDNLGVNKALKSKLMAGYDLQVSWDHAFGVLKNDYLCAHKLYFPAVLFLPLLSVKKYYTSVFSLLKCIACRLTWKFVFYIKTLTGERRENYLKQWHSFLVEFQVLLVIQEDPDVVKLLSYIVRLGRNEVDVEYVIAKLLVMLHRFDVILQSAANQSWTLQSQQPSSSVNQGSSGQAGIVHGILINAKKFMDDIRCAFKRVDFDVIRSLVKYIDDQSNW